MFLLPITSFIRKVRDTYNHVNKNGDTINVVYKWDMMVNFWRLASRREDLPPP